MRIRFPRLSDADRLFRRARLERALSRSLPAASRLTRVVVAGPGFQGSDHRLRLVRDRHRLVVQFDHGRVLRDDWYFFVYPRRAPVLIDLFARTDPGVTEAFAELSDGWDSGDGWISFSSFHAGAILVPDHDFYNTGGYAEVRRLALEPGPAWSEREGGFCWRGSSTGHGLITTPSMTPGDEGLIQRTRLCLLLRDVSDADVRISGLVQSSDPPTDRARLEGAGLLGGALDPGSWRGRKFAIDIDGNANAWSNLFTRLLQGCCVIKAASPPGFRQWYYEDLTPFEHYVPVAADLADLTERLEWCRNHDAECRRIAERGQALALSMTLEGELSKGVQRINQAFGVTAAGAPRANAI